MQLHSSTTYNLLIQQACDIRHKPPGTFPAPPTAPKQVPTVSFDNSPPTADWRILAPAKVRMGRGRDAECWPFSI